MRIAALLPAATDITIALGAGDQLVAVTHSCTLPARWSHVERVTRSRLALGDAAAVDKGVMELSAAGAPLFELDENTLAAQRPDVILTQAVCQVCAVSEEDARAVASRLHPSPRVVTLGARTVEGILEDIATVGAAVGVDDEAEELVTGLRSRMRHVHEQLKKAAAPRPRVVVLEWTDPPFSAGHWVPEMVRKAGGVELIGKSGQLSRRITATELADARPDTVVVAPCGYDLDRAMHEAKGLSLAKPTWVLDANRFTSSPGPGVVRGIEVLARILHPQLFGPPSTSDAVILA